MVGDLDRPTPGGAGDDPVEIEKYWQARWAADRQFESDLERMAGGSKFYNLVEFPYPSAEGLHVGHAYTYSGADTYGRYLRMRGREVFQPIGFDSFGIHAENYALKVGEHPNTLTARTIANYRRQLSSMGVAWDWSHQVVTSDPAYYRWTQWVFLKLHDAGLAVRRQAAVVWCPSCLTVLANEQLEGDRCERCGTRVTQRSMPQWFLRITAYAEELLSGLDGLDWPESAKRGQREWIGRSEGVEIDFEVADKRLRLSAFTTRPDTLFGVTFLVIPPEHPLLDELIKGRVQEDEVRRFVDQTASQRKVTWARTDGRDAYSPAKGTFTGAHARHPATGGPVPIYVADYVVAAYGTGAVMGVPAHDERDWGFARAAGLPVTVVIRPPERQADIADTPWPGEGELIDSGRFSGLRSDLARNAITEWLEARGAGRRAIGYRLRDWLISRQRYWGPPIPIVYCDDCGAVPVPEHELPVLLPDLADFRPTGTGASPLAASHRFVNTRCPSCAGPARRETDVSDNFLDSSWYFLRYPSSDVDDRPWDPERTRLLLPVDMYAGGPEHVMRHHLYARFVTRALHDLGLVPFAEPFPCLRLHGMLLKDGAKMSKSRGNVVNPDSYITRHGADVTRMYLLFIGPWNEGGHFAEAGIIGIERFVQRVWRLVVADHRPGADQVDLRVLDRTVAAVSDQLDHMKFNTAIASVMELTNWARRERGGLSDHEWGRVCRTLIVLLAPFAPHLAEELWARVGGHYSVHQQPWPVYDPAALVRDEVTVVIQVDGMMRDRMQVRAGTDQQQVVERALACQNVSRHLGSGKPKNVIFVPDRLINFVTR
jgi:leucyl-tRNA synthetase